MSFVRTLAIAKRIFLQIRHDRRSVALIIGAPIMVMTLVGLSLSEQKDILDQVAPALIATFAFFFSFLLTGVSFLRERAYGTLERLLTTPVGRGDILVGYLSGFLIFAWLQSMLIMFYTIFVLQIDYQGSLWQVFVLLLALTFGSVSLGIFVSTFARNEFQVVQFIPLILAPQVFLSGVIVRVEQLPGYLRVISDVLPLTYAVRGMQDIMVLGQNLRDVIPELAALVVFALVMMALALLTVRKT